MLQTRLEMDVLTVSYLQSTVEKAQLQVIGPR